MIRGQVGILEVGGSVGSKLHANGQVARGLAIHTKDGGGSAWDVVDSALFRHARNRVDEKAENMGSC